MKKTLVALSARINKLDEILFARADEDETSSPAKNAAGAAVGAGIVAGGAAAGRKIRNRVGGLRATVPGFTQQSRAAQIGTAAGSVGRDVLGSVKGAAKSVGSKLAGLRRIVRMSAKPTDRIIALSAKAEAGLVEFQRPAKEEKRGRGGAIAAGTLAAGGLGALGHANVQMRGGYRKVGGEIAGASRRAVGAVKAAGGNVASQARTIARRVITRK